jgi:hypothetical protein
MHVHTHTCIYIGMNQNLRIMGPQDLIRYPVLTYTHISITYHRSPSYTFAMQQLQHILDPIGGLHFSRKMGLIILLRGI